MYGYLGKRIMKRNPERIADSICLKKIFVYLKNGLVIYCIAIDTAIDHTNKKENKIFLIYKEIQSGVVEN
jgi:hypothetical protein